MMTRFGAGGKNLLRHLSISFLLVILSKAKDPLLYPCFLLNLGTGCPIHRNAMGGMVDQTHPRTWSELLIVAKNDKPKRSRKARYPPFRSRERMGQRLYSLT